MNDFFEDLVIPIGMVLLVIFLLICGMQGIIVTFFDNVPSKVFVDKKLIYEGSSAGFGIESSGYATQVKLYGGFLYFFPKAVYVSKDVEVEGIKP